MSGPARPGSLPTRCGCVGAAGRWRRTD
jgi:hypothetical protein